jgi:RHS repeat-associated protein
MRLINMNTWNIGTRRLALAMGLVLGTLASTVAQATVLPPNGTHSDEVIDLSVQTSVGELNWKRVFNGNGWRFNRHWDGITASYQPVLTQNTGGGSSLGASAVPAGASAGSTDGNVCWIWVSEDWQPGDGLASSAIQLITTVSPDSYIPPNRAYNQTGQALEAAVSSFFASCAASGGNLTTSSGGDVASEVLEGYRRQSQLFVGSNGTYIFKNRNVLTKQAVQRLPASSGEPNGAAVSLANLVTVANGWRWSDRGGDWMEYDDNGRVTRYGDKNNNTIWIQRNAAGQITHLLDAGPGGSATSARVAITLHYNPAGYLVQARDYPQSGNALDAPARSVSYLYDTNGRMTRVTDARGNATQYGYDLRARMTSVTDPLGRTTTMTYEDENNSVVQMTAADGGVSNYAFSWDDSKKLFYSKIQGPTSAAGRLVEDYTHDRAGDLVEYTVNARTELAIRRDPVARTESRTNARGFTTVYTKNEFEQVTQVQHPDGATRTTQYESARLKPIQMVDELGVRTVYTYDSAGNLTQKVEAQGTPDERTTEYTVNAAGWPTTITRKGRTEANGTITADATWQVEYDSAGQVSRTTDPEGHVRQYVYNRLGYLVQYTDPLGNTTRYEVDAHGNLTRVTDALGQVRSYSFDANNNLTSATDARGKAIQLAYDAMNRNTQVTNPVGGQYRQSYNTQGLPVSETDEDGRTSTAEYDNFLRLTRQVDALGNITRHSYSVADGTSAGTLGSLGYPTQVVYPTFTEQTRYDSRERPTSQTLLNTNAQGTEGLVSTSVYDRRGQMTSDTDAGGKTRFYRYNTLGQLTETTDSLGNKTQAQYDARGNLIQITDAKGQVNRFAFDRNNRLIAETLPLGQSTQYQYDAAGNLTQKTDPVGKRSEFSFDALNRVTQLRQYNTANTLQRTTTYTWDASDNLTAWTDTDATRPAGQQTSSATLSYDDANRKTSEVVSYPNPPTAGASGSGGSYTQGYSYQYSAAGYKTQLTWADGTPISYSYSQHGELENVSIPGEGSISVGEFKWIAATKVTLPGGTVQDRTLDGLLNLESLKVNTPGAQTVLRIDNTYGKVQELKTNNRTDTAPTSASSGSSTKNSAFTYDDETRLTQASTDTGGLFGTATENFTLDAVGNRIAHSPVSGAWTYDANNRLTQRGAGTCTSNGVTCYSWDDTGNLTQKRETAAGLTQVTQYRYDTQNRLVEVTDATNGQSRLVARYGYDPLDRRTWKEQYRDITGQPLPQAKRTYYLYADEGLIAEATQDITLGAGDIVTANSASTGTPTITTQYGPMPDSEFGTDVLFIKTRSSTGQDIVAYYHRDQLGTPVQATDKAGNVVWAASYNAFGQASITTPAPSTTSGTPNYGTITSNIRLPGQYLDAETGLHYNYRRYYDTQSGRYVTQDPIRVEGGINQYKYAEADPVNLSDPTGECPMCAAYAVCVASCMLEDAAVNAATGECNNLGDSAKSCAAGCLLGPLGRLGKWFKRAAKSCPFSFPSDTLVHVKPEGASAQDAQQSKATLKPISELQVGDEVLAFSEWLGKGAIGQSDQRLSYEKVTDLYTSNKPQKLIHLTLDDGQTISATESHPFKTTDGWRDAVMLKKGEKLLLKGGDDERFATIADIRVENKTLPVFNLEVANAHTFFVGQDGVLVHNARAKECLLGGGWDRAKKWFETLTDPSTVTTRSNGTVTGKTLTGKPVDLHTATSNNRTNVPTVGVHPPGQPPTKYRF